MTRRQEPISPVPVFTGPGVGDKEHRRRTRLAAAGAAAVIALSGAVAAADNHTGTQTVTIEVTVEPRELTVNDATVTLADVTYGFDYSDNANPGVSSGRLVAGSTGFIVKAGPNDASATAELIRLQDVTDPSDPTDVRWSEVFAGDTNAFSVRLSTVASCTPVIANACLGRTAASSLPTINAATTASTVTNTPVPLKTPSGTGTTAARLVEAFTQIPPFGAGVTGDITVNFWYLGRPVPPVDGGAPRTIEIELRYVLADV